MNFYRPCCLFRRRLAGVLWIVASTLVLVAVGARVCAQKMDPHMEADGVASKRFEADYNEWRSLHPSGPDHFMKIDRKDLERWKAVRRDWDTLEKDMREAGY